MHINFSFLSNLLFLSSISSFISLPSNFTSLFRLFNIFLNKTTNVIACFFYRKTIKIVIGYFRDKKVNNEEECQYNSMKRNSRNNRKSPRDLNNYIRNIDFRKFNNKIHKIQLKTKRPCMDSNYIQWREFLLC